MSSAAIPIGLRPKVRPAAPARWLDWLGNLLARELAPSPRKFRVALRIATIGTVGAALIASCHVNNELGTYLIWLLVGAGPMMSFRRAAMLLVLIGLALTGSVVMARLLAETPWLMLPYLFAIGAWSTYIGNQVKLGAGLLLIQVVSLNVYYQAIFALKDVGWFASGAFAGCAIALGTLVLFDNWLWPERGESLLREALANTVKRVRARLMRAGDFYLGHPGAKRPPLPAPTSDLPEHMALLDRAVTEGIDAHRHAVLLAMITRIARISIEVNRLIAAARDTVPGAMQALLGADIEAALDAIAVVLDEIVDELRGTIPVGVDDPPPPSRLRAHLAMEALRARIAAARPTYLTRATHLEIENFAAVIDVLNEIGSYIERLLDAPPAASAAIQQPAAAPQPASIDAPMVRYSLKVGLCIVIGYFIGLASQHANLSTILTTVLIVALPNYGAAFRKMVLRIIGSLIGGAVSLLAIVIVSPNFETLPAYLIAVFVVFYLSGYSSLSSGRVSYAGKQLGTTFALVFAGLSPSLEIYSPLYRIWGILLGTFIVAVIALILWPEYAGDSLLPRLRRVISDTLALLPGGAASRSNTLDEVNADTMQVLAEMLAIADDAQLEGRSGTVDHAAIIEAASNLRRIANRLTAISSSNLATPTPELDPITQAARDAVHREVRRQLEAWLGLFSASAKLNAEAAHALASAQSALRIEQPLEQMESRLEENNFARLSSWTIDQRGAMLAEFHSLHRIAVLLPELNGWLARIFGSGG